MALDKVLKIYDEQGNSVDYDILASDVKFLPDGKDLPTKLTEMEDAIEDAGSGDGTVTGVKVGNTPYNPDSNGVVDLSVPFADKATKTELQNAINSLQSALDALIGSGNVQGAIDTFNEVVAFLNGINSSDTLAAKLALKANDNAVVKSISVNNGTPAQPDSNGNVNIQVQTGSTISPATNAPLEDGTAAVGSSAKYAREDHVHPHDTSKLSKSDVSVETQGDGKVDIKVKDDTYTINLNHTHENMAKLVVCEESDLPSTLDPATIYAQVDDADTPTEIQSLWIAGLEFVGGGGGVVDDTPKLTSPRTGATIDFDGQSTTTLVVKGKNLISNLSVRVTGDFTVTANGQSVSTIAAADVTDGASLTLTLTKGSTFDFHGGSLVINSSDLTEQVSVRVIDSQASPVPAGYTRLNSVKPVSSGTKINTHISAYGSSWRLKVVGVFHNSAEVLISRGSSAEGAYFGILGSGKWGLTSGKEFDNEMGSEIDAIVSFSASNSISVTIGNTTLTQEQTQNVGVNNVLLFNTDKYPFKGSIHEVECVSGGASFHLYPAKRVSDNVVGLYDAENGEFYTGFEESNI